MIKSNLIKILVPVSMLSLSACVPSNSIIGFEGTTCPEGYNSLENSDGRFLVGYKNGPLEFEGAPKTTLIGPGGGAHEVTVKAENLPDHSHYLPNPGGVGGTSRHLASGGGVAIQNPGGKMVDVKNSKLSTIPKYYVVSWCKKR